MFAKFLFSTGTLSANAQRQESAECTQDPPQSMDLPHWVRVAQAKPLALTEHLHGKPCFAPYQEVGSTITFLLCMSNTHGKAKPALNWDRPGRRLPIAHSKSTVKRQFTQRTGSHRDSWWSSRCQGRFSLGTIASIITCTGKHGRRPTTIEIES